MTARAFRLVADIGGTNARFALLKRGSTLPEDKRTLLCAEFPGPVEAVRHYLEGMSHPAVDEAAFDVATGITGDEIALTNGPWKFSVVATRQALKLNRLEVINDFTALAMGVPLLQSDERHQVGTGSPVAGAAVGVIGPGTGLGVSGLLPYRGRWIPIQGEGGHTAFSPMSAREDDVLHHLRRRFGEHVSTERLVSGPGMASLYGALCEMDQAPVSLTTPQQITKAALSGADAHAAEALELFCAMLGTAAANLAAILGARGGIYIGGGIVPRLGDYFQRSPFRARFEQKGRFRSYVSGIPTYVIVAGDVALRGLANLLESPA